jgi:signal peptidase I
MLFFTPRYLKHAKLLHKGVTRFLNYKRDLLPAAKLDEIETLRSSLEDAMKTRNKERLKMLNEEINRVCEKAMPEAAPSEIGENIEVIFVAIVIALGIRAYIAQPFQIPTGSMQPTLNGITAEATAEDPSPGPLGWIGSLFTSTRYINVVSEYDGYLDERQPLTEHRFLIFMPYCKLHLKDGRTIKINAPQRQLLDELQLANGLRGGEPIKKGQLLARGIVRNGDHVLVDKVSYHFRTPSRGEVFVFTTKHIDRINVPAEQGSQHYIKRLAGLPGDLLDVQSPKLFINGKEAEEDGFKNVMQGTRNNPVNGYRGYGFAEDVGGRVNKINLQPEDYFAMGDNSYNSSDSRVWGPVPERNIVGTALFCYWPLTKHWGRIR